MSSLDYIITQADLIFLSLEVDYMQSNETEANHLTPQSGLMVIEIN